MISYIRGYYVITVEGVSVERFLNHLMRNGIKVYNVKKISSTKIEFNLDREDIKAFKNVYRGSNFQVKIKQSRRAKDAGNQKAVIRHTELQSAERKKKIGYKTEKRNVDRRRYLPCGSDRPDSCEESDRWRWSRWRECSLCGFRRNDHRDRTWDTEPVYRSG